MEQHELPDLTILINIFNFSTASLFEPEITFVMLILFLSPGLILSGEYPIKIFIVLISYSSSISANKLLRTTWINSRLIYNQTIFFYIF